MASVMMFPKHEILCFNAPRGATILSVQCQFLCSTNYLVLKRRRITVQETVLNRFILFILFLHRKIFYSKLLRCSHYGESDGNFLSFERKELTINLLEGHKKKKEKFDYQREILDAQAMLAINHCFFYFYLKQTE